MAFERQVIDTGAVAWNRVLRIPPIGGFGALALKYPPNQFRGDVRECPRRLWRLEGKKLLPLLRFGDGRSVWLPKVGAGRCGSIAL